MKNFSKIKSAIYFSIKLLLENKSSYLYFYFALLLVEAFLGKCVFIFQYDRMGIAGGELTKYATSVFIIPLIVIYFAITILNPLIMQLTELCFQRMQVFIKARLALAILTMPYDSFSQHDKGYYTSVYTKDSYLVAQFNTKKLLPNFSLLIRFILSCVLIAFLDLRTIFIEILALAVILSFRKINQVRLEATLPGLYSAFDKLTAFYHQIIDNASSIRMNRFVNMYQLKYNGASENLKKQNDYIYTTHGKISIFTAIVSFVTILVILMLNYYYPKGTLSFVKLFLLFLLSRELFISADRMIEFFFELEKSATSIERIKRMLEAGEKPMTFLSSYSHNIANTNSVASTSTLLELNNIWFRFPFATEGEKRWLFSELNLSFESGKIYGISGESGGGKSTLLHLIGGLYAPTQGSIVIKNSVQGIADAQIAHIGQRPFLLKGSIRENLCCDSIDSSAEELNKTLSEVGLLSSLKYFARGFETDLDEYLGGLSGGQIQRLEVARAMLRKASIYLFDEPTSGLDSESKEKILQVIERLRQENSIVIVASHDQSLLKLANVRLHVEQNKIYFSPQNPPINPCHS
ncbi:ABC transporter ATP-binding protein [Fluviispira vulneris]|uniref:ABC transporter ATP-binding protein n=1 Tax=Fluviispira vulneris TaxID=2763012 RepID=UPI0016447C07|nr:ABC transporter ATP-binding protein [Fluviispira vulneris]